MRINGKYIGAGVILAMLLLTAFHALGWAEVFSPEDVQSHMEVTRSFVQENATFVQQVSNGMIEYVQTLEESGSAFFSIEATGITSDDGQTVIAFEESPQMEALSTLFPVVYCTQNGNIVEFRRFAVTVSEEKGRSYIDICLTYSEIPMDESWEPWRVSVPDSNGYWYCTTAEYVPYNDPRLIDEK